LVIKLPFARGQLGVYLADPPLPVKIFLGDLMPPEGIDIDHRKGGIFLFGDCDLDGMAAIVDQIMRVGPDHLTQDIYGKQFFLTTL
jgi:hypothetical protein